jgi:peptidoglycan/LPS O-acetylase OafA/YrhL
MAEGRATIEGTSSSALTDGLPGAAEARAATVTPPVERERLRMGGLDALRMFAAGLVFINHLAIYGGVDFGPLEVFALHGGVGVIVFFVLSGYLLIRPFLYAPVSWRSYALRRLARIFPAYYLALVGSSFIMLNTQLLQHPLEYLTLTQNYDPAVSRTFVDVSWTLTIELAFYAVVPFIAAGLSALSRLRALEAVVIGMAASLVGIICTLAFYRGSNLVYVYMPFFLWVFGLGILLALVERDWAPRLRVMERHGLWVGLVLLVCALYIGAYAPLDLPTAAAAICLVAALRRRRVPSWASVLGDRCSYSFYLWHEQIIRALGGFTAGWPLAIIAGPASIAISLVSYKVVERPAQRWAARRSRAATEVRHAPADVAPARGEDSGAPRP